MINSVDNAEMARHLRRRPAFGDQFRIHMVTKNIRIEADLIDQLFNSSDSEWRARSCCSRGPVSRKPLTELAESIAADAGGDGGDDAVPPEFIRERIPEAHADVARRLSDCFARDRREGLH